MDLKQYFDNIDLSEIERMVTDGQEENVHIEFKTVIHPNYNIDNREFDKKNFSEVISGFANSNGGILIWGVKAKKNENNQDIASQKKPIKELTRFLNLLNRLEGQAVSPIITGIIHKKIEIEKDEGFVITYIPSSDIAPHMANYAHKHYYKRSGDSFYICEHYDIMDMIHRKTTAKLDLIIKERTEINQNVGNGKITRYEKIIALANLGQHLAKAPLLRVEINDPFFFPQFGLDGNGNIGLFKTRALPRNLQLCTYMGGQDVVVYPDIQYDIDKITLEISNDAETLPDLIINYMIVAENMDKINNTKIIQLKKT
jgi:hypothetical protein